MKKLFKISVLAIILLVFTTGCTSKNNAYEMSYLDIDWSPEPDVKQTYNQGINAIAKQLFKNNRIKRGDKITIASFVDLHKLNKTTHFGRNVSESMFNDLHVRGFNVVDARGSKTFRINASGEFFITRDIKLLNKKRIENSYILVGTYSKFGKGILLNARIIDNLNGDVVSTARTIINVDTCSVYENCKKDTYKRTISISDAGCFYVNCPTNCYDEKCGYDKPTYRNTPLLQSKKVVGCK